MLQSMLFETMKYIDENNQNNGNGTIHKWHTELTSPESKYAFAKGKRIKT